MQLVDTTAPGKLFTLFVVAVFRLLTAPLRRAWRKLKHTVTGRPRSEGQQVDSAEAGFSMPDNWHWRLVDATNGRDHRMYGFRLVSWDPSGETQRPYRVSDGQGYLVWVEHIRFVNIDPDVPYTQGIHEGPAE